jgi:hypothetical protein
MHAGTSSSSDGPTTSVVGFQYEDDARRFKEALHDRFQRFSLELHPEKTRLIRFGRFALRDGRRFDGRRKPERATRSKLACFPIQNGVTTALHRLAMGNEWAAIAAAGGAE